MPPLLIIPGLKGSPAGHWQSDLEHQIPSALRVVQDDWESPDIAAWAMRIHSVARQCETPPLAVAHSFGALALTFANLHFQTPLTASFLVAPADPRNFGIADETISHQLAHPSDLIASINDTWLEIDRAQTLASIWGSRLHVLGAFGHINIDSGFGPWPDMLRWVHDGRVDGVICL